MLDDKVQDCGRLKISIGRPGRSSLPVLGYVPRVRPKSSICPPSPRLRRAGSLSPARVAKKLDLQSRAEAEALSFADIDKPWGAGGKGLSVDAFGHE